MRLGLGSGVLSSLLGLGLGLRLSLGGSLLGLGLGLRLSLRGSLLLGSSLLLRLPLRRLPGCYLCLLRGLHLGLLRR